MHINCSPLYFHWQTINCQEVFRPRLKFPGWAMPTLIFSRVGACPPCSPHAGAHAFPDSLYLISNLSLSISLCFSVSVYVSVIMGLFVNFFIDRLIDWLTNCKAVTLKHCRADANLCLLHFTSSVCWHWCLLQCCPRLPPSDLCNCSRSSGESVCASLRRASRRAPRWTQFMQISR